MSITTISTSAMQALYSSSQRPSSENLANQAYDAAAQTSSGATAQAQASVPAGPPPPPPPPPLAPATQSSSTTGLLSGNLTGDQQNSLNSLSSLLDTEPESLLNDLQNGQSLSSMIQDAQIDASTLASVIQDGLLFDTRA